MFYLVGLLGSLDELEAVEGLLDQRSNSSRRPGHSRLPSLTEMDEEEWENTSPMDSSQTIHYADGTLQSLWQRLAASGKVPIPS